MKTFLIYLSLFTFVVWILHTATPLIKAWATRSHHCLQNHATSKQAIKAYIDLLQAQGHSQKSAGLIAQTRWRQLMITLLAVLALLAITQQWIFALLCILMPVWMWMRESKKLHLRNKRIYHRFPYFLDILILCLESGMDSIASMKQIIRTTPDHPLHREIGLAMSCTEIGMSFSQAMEEVAKRTRSQELIFLSTSIQQSAEMGSSLADILRMQAQTLRQKIYKQAQTQAQKAPVKMLFPLIFFIFPVVFILLFLPIGMSLMRAF